MKFKTYYLSEIASVQTGPFGSQLHKEDYVEDGIPIITVEHLGDNKILHQNLPRVGEFDYQRLSKYHLQTNDIVFSRVGSVDRRALVSEKENGWMFSGRCLRVRITDSVVNPIYLSYLFGTDTFKEYIRSIAVGATMPSINTKILSDIQVNIPSLEIQHKVIDILYKLDLKIWNNESLIINLEELSQTIFKHWFIDFEFPNEDGLQYKLSGGKMVGSELGEIPDGWRVGTLEDIFELKYGKALTKKNRLPGDYPVYGSGGITDYHKDYLIKGPGIILGRKGSIGTLYYEQDNFYPIDTVFYIESEEYSLNYIYSLLKTYDFTKSNNDSAVPGLNRNLVYASTAIVPNLKVIKQFESIIAPIFEKIFSLETEIKTLNNLRSHLLPKLLSGEIEIPDESVVV